MFITCLGWVLSSVDSNVQEQPVGRRNRVGHMLEDGRQQGKGDHHDGAVCLGYEKPEALNVTHSPSDLQRLVRMWMQMPGYTSKYFLESLYPVNHYIQEGFLMLEGGLVKEEAQLCRCYSTCQRWGCSQMNDRVSHSSNAKPQTICI